MPGLVAFFVFLQISSFIKGKRAKRDFKGHDEHPELKRKEGQAQRKMSNLMNIGSMGSLQQSHAGTEAQSPSTPIVNGALAETPPSASEADATTSATRAATSNTTDNTAITLAELLQDWIPHQDKGEDEILGLPKIYVVSGIAGIVLFTFIIAMWWYRRTSANSSSRTTIKCVSVNMPLNLSLARVHGTNTCTQTIPMDAPKCQCSDYGIPCSYRVGEWYSLLAGKRQLSELGPGWALYFDFIKYLAKLLVFYIVMYLGVVCFYAVGPHVHCFGEDDDSNTIQKWWYSLGNWGPGKWNRDSTDCKKTGVAFPWMVFYHCICIAGTVVSAVVYQNKQLQVAVWARDELVTPNMFTVLIRGLPNSVTEQDVQDFCRKVVEDASGERAMDPVVGVILLYDYGGYYSTIVQLDTEAEKLKGLQSVLDRQESFSEADPAMVENLEESVSEQTDYCEKLQEEVAQIIPNLEIAGALVTFHQVPDRILFTHQFQSRGVCSSVPCCGRLYASTAHKPRFQGESITVEQAPDPSDIRWDNQGVSCLYQWVTWIWGFLMTLAVAAGSYYMVKELNKVKHGNKKVEDGYYAMFYSVVIALVITIVNLVTPMIMRFLTSLSCPSTYSDTKCGEMWRTTLAQVVGSTFVFFWVHFERDVREDTAECGLKSENLSMEPVKSILKAIEKEKALVFLSGMIKKIGCHNWFGSTALVQDVASFVVFTSGTAWLLVMLPPAWWMKKFQQWYIRLRFAIGKPPTGTTQAELNQVFEGPEVRMPHRYAAMINFLTITLTFMPVMPVLALIALVGLFLLYWADKIFLLRFAKHPYYAEHKSPILAVRLILVCCWPQAIFTLILVAPSTKENYGMTIISTIALFATPALVALSIQIFAWSEFAMQKILQEGCQETTDELEIHQDQTKWPTYYEAKPSFQYQYHKMNPISRFKSSQEELSSKVGAAAAVFKKVAIDKAAAAQEEVSSVEASAELDNSSDLQPKDANVEEHLATLTSPDATEEDRRASVQSLRTSIQSLRRASGVAPSDVSPNPRASERRVSMRAAHG